MKQRQARFEYFLQSLCLLTLTPLLGLFLISDQMLTATIMHTQHIAKAAASYPVPVPHPISSPTFPAVLTVTKPLPVISAPEGFMIDEKTGDILFDKQGEKTVPMASTTKIMTAIVAIQTANLSQIIPVTQMAANRIYDDGSSAGLIVGDKLTLKQMLYALLLPSGDDAAFAIAEALGNGSIDTFVQRMNLFAERHDLFQTHYDDPDGLNPIGDDEHYTTARDLVRLGTYAMSLPLFAQIVKTQTYSVTTADTTYAWTNTNPLLSNYKGMLGVKTGFTNAAGYCLVFSATRGKDELIGAVLGEASEAVRSNDVTTLLNWGFSLPLRSPYPKT